MRGAIVPHRDHGDAALLDETAGSVVEAARVVLDTRVVLDSGGLPP
jgi:hypothetical protein